jgi:processive 1,2-diacylglycerol beta-glucosyltransferase
MKKILFFPLLNIPSGHHQVVYSIIDAVNELDSSTKCEVVELLSFSYGKVEKYISKMYLIWIKFFPSTYKWVYKVNAINKTNPKYRLYSLLFMRSIKKLLDEKQPDFLVCTHALPSYLINELKKRDNITIPVLNVYTDYFINNIWGKSHIDYHFVPDQNFREYLIEKGVIPDNIFVTGIPVHRLVINEQSQNPHRNIIKRVLITGGSLGCGEMKKLINRIEKEEEFEWLILCGKNDKLYKSLLAKRKMHIIPLGYIKSKTKMANVYKSVDAILTKPGGVTLSESLLNKIPIFVYHVLPGQEEMNLHHLESLNLVYRVKLDTSITEQLKLFFETEEVSHFQHRLHNYLNQIETKSYANVLQKIIM